MAEQVGADQPVSLFGGLAQYMLLDQYTEHVRYRFIERPGLIGVKEPGFTFDHAVGQFVADQIQGASEALEDFAIAVAEHHLRTVPERILVLLPVMHGANQGKTLIVDRVAAMHFPEEIIARPQGVIGFVDRWVTCRRLALNAHRHPRQEHLALGVMDTALGQAGPSGRWQQGGRRRARWRARSVAQRTHVGEGALRTGTLPLGAAGDDAVEDIGRNETVR